MAFRIAELIERAENGDAVQAEEAKKEATDLILRLWEMRERWPQGAPMGRLDAFVRKGDPGEGDQKHEVESGDWLALLGALSICHGKDLDVLLDAFVSELDLGSEDVWAIEAGKELSKEELKYYKFFKARQNSLRASMSYRFGSEKNLFEMSPAELRKWVKTKLSETESTRQKAVKTAISPKSRAKKREGAEP